MTDTVANRPAVSPVFLGTMRAPRIRVWLCSLRARYDQHRIDAGYRQCDPRLLADIGAPPRRGNIAIQAILAASLLHRPR